MLTEIAGLPENVFGVRATGEVDADDLKNVLLPGLKNLADRFDEIRYLLVLETDVKNFTAAHGCKMQKQVCKILPSGKKSP